MVGRGEQSRSHRGGQETECERMPQLVGFLCFFIVFYLGPRCGMALPEFRVSHLDSPPGNALTEAPSGALLFS